MTSCFNDAHEIANLRDLGRLQYGVNSYCYNLFNHFYVYLFRECPEFTSGGPEIFPNRHQKCNGVRLRDLEN